VSQFIISAPGRVFSVDGCIAASTGSVGVNLMTNLTAKELDRVLSIVTVPQHRCFLMLGYYHGMRRGELLRLTADDITAGHVRIHRLKRRKTFVQVQPLHPKEKDEIEAYVATLSVPPKLFPWGRSVASNLVRRYLTDAGIYTFPYQKALHSLRHSCGRALYRASKDIVVVADYLGHSSVESSRRYIHSDLNEVHEIAKGAL
jgi:integrase